MPPLESPRDPEDIAEDDVTRRALGVALRSAGDVKAPRSELSAPIQFMPRIPSRALKEILRLVGFEEQAS
jgi:hypothetical protein